MSRFVDKLTSALGISRAYDEDEYDEYDEYEEGEYEDAPAEEEEDI